MNLVSSGGFNWLINCLGEGLDCLRCWERANCLSNFCLSCQWFVLLLWRSLLALTRSCQSFPHFSFCILSFQFIIMSIYSVLTLITYTFDTSVNDTMSIRFLNHIVIDECLFHVLCTYFEAALRINMITASAPTFHILELFACCHYVSSSFLFHCIFPNFESS